MHSCGSIYSTIVFDILPVFAHVSHRESCSLYLVVVYAVILLNRVWQFMLTEKSDLNNLYCMVLLLCFCMVCICCTDSVCL